MNTPASEHCDICGEDFDPAKDPYHRENCRDSVRP